MKYIIIVLILILSIVDCASMQVSQRKQEIEEMMNPLFDKSKEDVILALGTPTDIEFIEGLEVYHYYQSYGTKGGVYITPGEYISTGGMRTWEQYDIINIYFRNDKMIKWDCFVQR